MATSGNDDLTPRERDVLELLKQFWTNAEISRGLGIDQRTVETHVSHVLHKLGHASRRDLWEDMLG
jgi:DNA-binding NarL/FixJ family response regulator